MTGRRELMGNHKIYVIDADGSDGARLTDNPGFRPFARLVARRQHVAFESFRGGNQEIYVTDLSPKASIQSDRLAGPLNKKVIGKPSSHLLTSRQSSLDTS